MYKLLVLACWVAVASGGGSPVRSYAFSYAMPDGQSRFESSKAGNLHGGYQYRTPEGAVVAVRYSNDVHAFRATGDNYERHYDLPGAYRRLYSYTSGGRPLARSFITVPKQSYAFSYATPDGQSRYETNEGGAVKGGYQYSTPDGTTVKVRYTADEKGFRTHGENYVIRTGPGSTARAATYTYPVLPVARTVPKAPSQVLPPVTYVQPAAPSAQWVYVRDDDDDDDFDLDDDDVRLVRYYQGHPSATYGAATHGYYRAYPYYYPPTAQRYTVPVGYSKGYNTAARVAYQPSRAFGYFVHH